MLTLYHGANSVCSVKVRIVLAEKGLAWEGRHIDLPRGEHLQADYLKINSRALVPVLDHDGVLIRESTVICEYLDGLDDATRLVPPGALERMQSPSWQHFRALCTKMQHPSRARMLDEGLWMQRDWWYPFLPQLAHELRAAVSAYAAQAAPRLQLDDAVVLRATRRCANGPERRQIWHLHLRGARAAHSARRPLDRRDHAAQPACGVRRDAAVRRR